MPGYSWSYMGNEKPKKKLWRYSCEMPYKCEGRYEYPKGHAFHPDNQKKRK